MMRSHPNVTKVRQRGTALVVSLVFLLLLTILAVTAVSTSTLEEKMAGNVKDKNLAFQAAEAALVDAELRIRNNTPGGFTAACTGGLCLPAPSSSTPVWNVVDWSNGSTTSIPYGSLTGANYTALGTFAQSPRYIIEDLPEPPASTSDSSSSGSLAWDSARRARVAKGGNYYRITARAVGGTPNSQVMVQSIYVK